MSVAEHGLRRVRMSWEDYLALPDHRRAEFVDGEVVMSPPVGPEHGVAVAALVRATAGLDGLWQVPELGVHLPGNRLRGPDLVLADSWPDGTWATEAPIVVVEVLSPSTRTEDLERKPGEYFAGGAGQYWIVDPHLARLDVLVRGDDEWRLLLRLDHDAPAGEVAVGEHGTVALDLREILPRSFA